MTPDGKGVDMMFVIINIIIITIKASQNTQEVYLVFDYTFSNGTDLSVKATFNAFKTELENNVCICTYVNVFYHLIASVTIYFLSHVKIESVNTGLSIFLP